MDVLLINPPYCLPEDDIYSKTGACLPPLGLLYIAAYLREKASGINVHILDGAYRLNLEQFKNRLECFHPDVVGITVYTITFSIVLKIAKLVKEIFPNCIIVVGGPHASLMPEQSLNSPHIDIVVVGEGEEVFTELIDCISKRGNMDKVPNIVYENDRGISRTQIQPRMINLDTAPMPARDLIDMKLYHPAHGTFKRLPATNMITSRGCPFRCSFCSKNIFGSWYRAQSSIKIIEEIETLIKNYGIREVLFNDDVFTMDKKRTDIFCDLLIQKRLDFTWSCSTRVNLVNPPLLKKMRKSGCFGVSYGIESGDAAILRRIDKDLSVKAAKEAIRWTKEAGIETRTAYILGLPGETKETINKTIGLSLELDTDFVIYNIFVPLPGTEMYEEAKAGGMFLYDDTEFYDRIDAGIPLIKLSNVSPLTLIQLQRSAYKKYYMRPKYIFNQLKRIQSISDLNRYSKGFFSFLRWYKKR